MPRYYFHISDGATLILDDDGCELASDAAAMTEAVQSARDLHLQDATEHFFTSQAPYIAVCDDVGSVVLTQPIRAGSGMLH